MNKISDLEKSLKINFLNKQLLQTALTHRSFLNENRKIKEHNERFEFLGDAVLELLVTQYLFDHCPKEAEGVLTSFRSASVKTDTLAEISRKLEFGKYLLMSKGEERTGGKDKNYLLANTFEAVLGALYLDQGFDACKKFLEKVLFPVVDVIVENRLDIDPKTQFQEIAQEMYKETPSYRVVEEAGPDHEKTFIMGVFIGKKEMGRGKGASKQKAEEEAAQKALEGVESTQ